MQKRRYLIAGNWKMNKTSADTKALVEGITATHGEETRVDIAVCPPFTVLAAAREALGTAKVALGAQNLYPQDNGAYTGEVAPGMLTDLGCTYVILGHSERREYFKEDDAFINEKVKAAFANGLIPILCVGETLEQREAEQTLQIVETQLRGGLDGLEPNTARSLVIAYEPVWAIGTGKTATPEMAQEVHAVIRNVLRQRFGEEIGEGQRILYGGSMKPGNAAELLAQPDIDGGLIGGASLDADSFNALIGHAAAAD